MTGRQRIGGILATIVLGMTGCVAVVPPDPAQVPLAQSVLPPPATEAAGPAEGDTIAALSEVEPVPEPRSEAQSPSAEPLAPPDPPMLAQQRAACARDGGTLLSRGARQGLYYCAYRTGDEGRSCDEASDCEGTCLARSGTCAPLRPLFGCQEVFTDRGRRETLCME